MSNKYLKKKIVCKNARFKIFKFNYLKKKEENSITHNCVISVVIIQLNIIPCFIVIGAVGH